jgi:hypothetical protein
MEKNNELWSKDRNNQQRKFGKYSTAIANNFLQATDADLANGLMEVCSHDIDETQRTWIIAFKQINLERHI